MASSKAWVVVDWRNLHGQFEEAGLTARLPDEDALCEVLAGYGMSLAGVSVGIGLAPAAGGVLKQMHDENLRIVRDVRARGWTVLEGLLRREDGEILEKMTDARCVLEAARLIYERPEHVESLVVLSRDADMVPAADLGLSKGFPVYLASASDKDPRNAPRLHLPVSVMRILAGKDPLADDCYTVTQTEFLLDPGPHEWVVEAAQTIHRLEGWRLRHENGSAGFLHATEGSAYNLGETLVLVTSDVHFGENDRPIAWCSSSVDTPERAWLVQARVVRRQDAGRVIIKVNGIEQGMRSAVGEAEPSQRLLVRLKRQGDHLGQQANVRLVGPLDVLPARSRNAGRLQVGRPLPVQIKSSGPRGSLAQGLDEDGELYDIATSNLSLIHI